MKNKKTALTFLILFVIGISGIKAQNAQTVKDDDGNMYTVIKIGKKLWTKENLKTTKYNDGTPIPNITDADDWGEPEIGAQCDYDNNPANVATYGKLYNWAAVKTGKLCPTGWHVPTTFEWDSLENYLITKGYNYDGTTAENKIGKSVASTTGWKLNEKDGAIGNNQTTNNKSGFTGLPAGSRDNFGVFSGVGQYSHWWSSSNFLELSGFYEYLYYSTSEMDHNTASTESGLSVRCVNN